MPLPPIHGLVTTIEVSSKGGESDEKCDDHWEESFSWWKESLAEANEVITGLLRQLAGATSSSSAADGSADDGISCTNDHDNLERPVEQKDLSPLTLSSAREDPVADTVASLLHKEGLREGARGISPVSGPSQGPAAVLKNAQSETSNVVEEDISAVPPASAGSCPRRTRVPCSRTTKTPHQANVNEVTDEKRSSGPPKRVRAGRRAAAALENDSCNTTNLSKSEDLEVDENEENLGDRSPDHKRSKRGAASKHARLTDAAATELPVVEVFESMPGASPALDYASGAVISDDERSAFTAEIAELKAIPVMSMKVVELRSAVRKFEVPSRGLKAELQIKLQDEIAARLAELEILLSMPGAQDEQDEDGERPGDNVLGDKDAIGEETTNPENSHVGHIEQAPLPPPIGPLKSDAPSHATGSAAGSATSGVAGVAPQGLGAQMRFSETRWSDCSDTASPHRVLSPIFSEDKVEAARTSATTSATGGGQSAPTSHAGGAAAFKNPAHADEDGDGVSVLDRNSRDDEDVKGIAESDAEREAASWQAQAVESSSSPSGAPAQTVLDQDPLESAAATAGEEKGGDIQVETLAANHFERGTGAGTGATATFVPAEAEGSLDLLLSPDKTAGDTSENVGEVKMDLDKENACSSGERQEEIENGFNGPRAARRENGIGDVDGESSGTTETQLALGHEEEVEGVDTASSEDTQLVGVGSGVEGVEEAGATQDETDMNQRDDDKDDSKLFSAPVDTADKRSAPVTTSKPSDNAHNCKTPSARLSLSSTSIPSSASSMGDIKDALHGVGTSSGAGTIGVIIAGAGVKRSLPSPDMEGDSGAVGSGSISTSSAILSGDRAAATAQQGGGEKRQKIGKEKLRLQEHMDRISKHYSAKKNQAAGGEGRVGPTALVAANTAAAALPSAGKPPALLAKAAPADPKKTLPLATVSADPAAIPPPGTSKIIEAMLATGAAKPVGVMQSGAVERPSNLISGLHSFTSLLCNKRDAPAPLGKWDRLTAGGGATARAVPALRKAEEARALEERRARERAAARFKTVAAAAPTTAAAGTEGSSVTAMREEAAPTTAGGRTRALMRTAVGASAGSGFSEFSASAGTQLQKTGMLAKLVPSAATTGGREGGVGGVGGGPLAEVAAEAMAATCKPGLACSSVLPPPFSRSTGMDAANAALGSSSLVEGLVCGGGSPTAESTASATSCTSAASGVSASDKIEMKIREQRDQRARAQLALKRNVNMGKIKADEEKKKAELEIKEKRDAVRLEATRRAKHEAETRAREQNAQRQVEAERRREHERLEKEIKESKDREEKEARRRKAAAEVKAKAMREQKSVATSSAHSANKPAPASADNLKAVPSNTSAVAAPTITAVLKPTTTTTAAAASRKAVAVLNPLTNRLSMHSSRALLGGDASKTVEKCAAATPAIKAPGGEAPESGEIVAAAPSTVRAPSAGPGTGVRGALAAAGAAAAPATTTAAEAAPVLNSYEISDKEGSDSGSDSDEEEETDRKKIPAWAKGSALNEALNQQYTGESQLDPDTIFPEVLSCDLEAIFAVKKSRYQRRGSSANWGPDRVSPHEILTYKRSVGIARGGK